MKTTNVLIALFLMLFSFSFAMADNIDNSSDGDTPMLISAQEDDSNISESEAMGNLFWKKADIWFTFNQEKKAEKELKLAELQLIRARVAAKNNNSEAMMNALEAHQRLIEKVQNRVSKFEDKDSAAKLRNATDKLVGLERSVEVHELRIERLNVLLNDSNLSADEIARIQLRIEQAENSTQHLRDVSEAQRERNELKIKAMNGTGNGSEHKYDSLDEDENESKEDGNGNSFSGNGKR
jgi:hypothetical protein